MKLKGLKYYILGLIGLPILFVNISNAGLQEFDIGVAESITANTNLGYTLKLTQNANFLTNDLYKVVQFKGNGQYSTTWTYFWNGTGMYVIESCDGGYSCNGTIQGQGYINYVNIVQLSTIDMQYAVDLGFTPIDDFLSNSDYNNPDKLLLGGYGDLQTSSFCFGYSDLDKAVCFSWNRAYWNNCSGYPQYCTNGQLSYITNSKGYTTQDIADLSSYATSSPFKLFNYPKPQQNDICVSIGSLKQSYGLTDNVCYAGFVQSDVFGDGSVFTAGTGMDITDVYSLYSGGMSFQGWYDTYYEYYKDINNNLDMFQGNSKALLGTFFARQTFGNNKGSYTILSYCNIIKSGVSDNATTCTINPDILGSGGLEISDDEIIDALIGRSEDKKVNTQSGFEYSGSLLDVRDDSYSLLSRFSAYEGYGGILPGYIILGFLGVFLLYALRR